MILGVELDRAGIRYLDLQAMHGKEGVSVLSLVVHSQDDLDVFNAWAKERGIPVTEARVATAEEIRRHEETSW